MKAFVMALVLGVITSPAIGEEVRGLAANPAQLDGAKRDFIGAQIKSSSDLRTYILVTPKDQSPFEKLSAGAKERFLAGLVFNENGLVGYDYSDLVSELGAADIYRLMSLFGAQRTVALIRGLRIETSEDATIGRLQPQVMMDDHENYRCDGGHTCIFNTGMICMTGC
jgi:hypothetical protein